MTRIAEIADRLERLAKRREDEGIYTDADLCRVAAAALSASSVAKPCGVKTLEAAARLRENLASFDAEVASELASEGERADLWGEIDVNVEDLRAVLASPAPVPNYFGWRSIDTAPEDEHIILATSGGFVGEALMLIDEDTGRQKWTWALGPVHEKHVLYGWMPLPEPLHAPVASDLRPDGFDGPTGAE